MAEEAGQTTATTEATTQTDTGQTEGIGFLQSGQTAEATTTPETTATTQAKPGEQLIAGKYKTQDDLIKAHKELESKLGKVSAVPETYEISPDLAEIGITWQSDDQKATVSTMLKETGLRQDQFEKLMPVYVAQVQAEVGKLMHIVDASAEQTNLKKEWGNDYESSVKEVQAFAKTLPRELVFTPLQHSAAGMKLLRQMMQEKRGPELINSNDSGSSNVVSLQARLEQIVGDANYSANNKQGEQLRSEAYGLSKRISGQK